MNEEGMHNQYWRLTVEKCIECFLSAENKTPMQLADEIMRAKGYPMHSPTHHFLVPAVLLSLCRKAQGYDVEVLRRDLQLAMERAQNILGGFCGLYGACGAAVGLGIFWCVITDCSPLSQEAWRYGNAATGQALTQMAEYGGPRCCKRCTNLALLSSYQQILDVLGIDFTAEVKPVCQYSERNSECIKNNCPFYRDAGGEVSRKAIRLPTFAYPPKNTEHPCACQDRPVELTHKKGILFWRASAGDCVETDMLIAVFESEKRTMEIYAPSPGILRELLVEDGSLVDAETILAYLEVSQ